MNKGRQLADNKTWPDSIDIEDAGGGRLIFLHSRYSKAFHLKGKAE